MSSWKIRDRWQQLVNTPNEIVPGLYLSGREFASTLVNENSFGIQAVLNLSTTTIENCQSPPTSGVYDKNPLIEYLDVAFFDGEPIPEEKFRKSLEFLKLNFAAGKTILVHCNAGISRSPTLVASLLYHRWVGSTYIASLEDAIQHISKQREIVQPHAEVLRSAKIYLRAWPYDGSLER